MSFTFNAVELCVVTINEKSWTCVKEVCRTFECKKKTADIVKAFCSRENYAHKWQLNKSCPPWGTSWTGPGTREKMTIIPMRKGCTSCYFQVNSQRQKT